jgi:hypothetical protein
MVQRAVDEMSFLENVDAQQNAAESLSGIFSPSLVRPKATFMTRDAVLVLFHEIENLIV